MTPAGWNHAETAVQVIVGTAAAQVVLWMFGMPLGEALLLNGILIVLMYIRTYLVRSWFDWMRR